MGEAMNTEEIEVFLALAQELHFGRTAERLRLPSARVSRLVARMERRAGGRLFDRTSRRVQLTPLGVRLHGRLEPAYDQLQAAFDDARREARQAAGVVMIGFTSTTHGEALTGLVSAFEAGNHGCRVMLGEVDLFDPWADLRRGEVDVVVNWLAVDEPDLTAGPAIGSRDRVLAVGASHPLAARASVQAEELADWEVGGYFRTLPAALLDTIIPPCTPSGRPIRRVEAGIRSSGELLSEIARGRLIHTTVAGVQAFRRDDIALVPIEGLPPVRLGLIWRTAHENARMRALAATAAAITAPSAGRAGQAPQARAQDRLWAAPSCENRHLPR
jgi:DNA-binding transcriptional LysR family regulator